MPQADVDVYDDSPLCWNAIETDAWKKHGDAAGKKKQVRKLGAP
jgi:hypothetical protein